MKKLVEFFSDHGRKGDSLRMATNIVEMTRQSTGLYIRVVQTHVSAADDGGLYDLFVVKDGGEKPKQRWYNGESTHQWTGITRGVVKTRCERAMSP
jgi:hypothetical protein